MKQRFSGTCLFLLLSSMCPLFAQNANVKGHTNCKPSRNALTQPQAHFWEAVFFGGTNGDATRERARTPLHQTKKKPLALQTTLELPLFALVQYFRAHSCFRNALPRI